MSGWCGLNKRKTIRMPEWQAAPLKIGADAGRFGENGYAIENL